MQGGRLTSPAKSDWISIIWTGLSLLQGAGRLLFLSRENQQDHRFNRKAQVLPKRPDRCKATPAVLGVYFARV
jgi:hypothetical protein